ncbi:MAG: hypothetical protein WC547_09180 [Candidatus Omnitrophota bacterium]
MSFKFSRFNPFAVIAAMLSEKSAHRKMRDVIGTSGAYHQRFNLGGLPPTWKGKRQARINRGGK